MDSDGTTLHKPRAVADTVKGIASLLAEFSAAVVNEDEIMAGLYLDVIDHMIEEGKQVGSTSNSYDHFVNQLSLLHPHSIKALSYMNTKTPSWGAIIAEKQVMKGFVDEMCRKFSQKNSASPADSPPPRPVI